MVNNINNKVENTPSLPKDKKTQTQEMVKKEQESFSKLIQEKTKNTQVEDNKTVEKKRDIDLSKESLLAQNTAPSQLQNIKNTKEMPESKTNSINPKDTTNQNKTLNDIKQLAHENELNLQDMQLEQENLQETPKQETMGTQSLLEQKKLTNAIKATAISQPLAQALKEISLKDKESRMMQKAQKLEYKMENKTEKIAVIQRGKSLPKNIVEARLRNEKREMAYQNAFDRFGVKTKEETNVLQEALGSTEDKKKSLATS